MLGRADGYSPSGSLPSGAPRPDDASKAQFVMAGLLARGSLPSAAFPGIPSGTGLGLVAYSCGGSAGVERTRTGFPFHLPRGRTITNDANGRDGWGQPARPRGQVGLTGYGLLGQVRQEKGTQCRPNPSLNGSRLADAETEFLANAKVKLQATMGHKEKFVECIRSRKRPIADVEIGARTVTSCHLVNLAYRHTAKIAWDPAKLDFAAGTGKPEWLTRDYRGEWKV